MFDVGPVGVEGADRGKYAVAEGTEELERGSEAFWIWAPQGKGEFYLAYFFILRVSRLALSLEIHGRDHSDELEKRARQRSKLPQLLETRS